MASHPLFTPRQTTLPQVGLIGLGLIGSRVAAHLRRKGVSLFVWSRSPQTEPNFLSSPLEVAESADILQIFVRDGAALLQVLRQMSPALTAAHIVLNHATVAPHETLEAADIVNKRGAQFLDAPFTGSRDAAVEGKLIYYIGGSPEVLKNARSVLELSAEKILMMGPIGAATYVKLATNLIAAAQVESLVEALEFLTVADVPLHKLSEALQHNVGNSALIKMKLPQMLKADFEPRFSSKNMLKDIQLLLKEMLSHGSRLPVAESIATALRETCDRGWGDSDYSVLACRYSYPGKNHLLPSLENDDPTIKVEKKDLKESFKKNILASVLFWKKKNNV